VHIGPSADQLHLRDAVRELLAAERPLTLNTYTNHQAWQPLWKTMVGLGWTGLARRGLVDDHLGLATSSARCDWCPKPAAAMWRPCFRDSIGRFCHA
jgi:hypothetical protein